MNIIKPRKKSMANRKQRVLISGIGQSNFIKQLYSSLNEIRPDQFAFGVVGLKELSGKDEYGEDIFEDIYNVSVSPKLFHLRHLFCQSFFDLFLYFCRSGATVGELWNFSRRYVIYRQLYLQIKRNGYQKFHFHFPVTNYLDLLWHLEPEDECIVSFWGSDLMRVNGIFNYAVQLRALNRANKITTHGVEMKEMILTKFGRHLASKIQFVRFPPYNRLYQLIQRFYPDSRALKQKFSIKMGLPEEKKWIVVGHSGAEENNHLEIIKQLAFLPEEIKEEVFFLFPFTYGSSNRLSYAHRVDEQLLRGQLKGKILVDFLSWEDLALLKCLTEILIHLPVSDALSGTVTEATYAGSRVIVGDWLPYSPFIKAGLKFETVSNLDDVGEKLVALLALGIPTTSEIEHHQKVIEDHFLSVPCAMTWLPVFDIK